MSAAKMMVPSEDLLFRDGLGDRLLIRDAHGRPAHECLLIRPELSSVPAFELALNERLWLVEKFDHPAFLTVRNIIRTPGRIASTSLVYDLTGGTRLSDVLARAASGGQPITAGAAVFLLKEVLDALAELHRQSGELAHGAIAPERIVLADGRVRIADYVLGPGIEQLRYTTERYWKELRVAVPSSAGGARLDRRVDVVQAALVAVAMFAGRPLGDTEHLSAIGDVLMSISVPQPIRGWLLRALHMDPRRVFVHAGEASKAFTEAINESGVRPAPGDLDLQRSRSMRIAPPAAPRLPVLTPIVVAVAKSAPVTRTAAAAPTFKRDVWQDQAHDVDQRSYIQPGSTIASSRKPVSATFRKVLLIAVVIGVMAAAFTGAQFIPAPEWMFSHNGTLVIESTPQGIKVLVNGKPQGVTPLTLKVEAGIHEVELFGPGKPRIFKVHVTRGDRVAQYIEFLGRR
ncbi:MAG TPA: PEGA domain-containing protein [Vicinamibacterales bacterium]